MMMLMKRFLTPPHRTKCLRIYFAAQAGTEAAMGKAHNALVKNASFSSIITFPRGLRNRLHEILRAANTSAVQNIFLI